MTKEEKRRQLLELFKRKEARRPGSARSAPKAKPASNGLKSAVMPNRACPLIGSRSSSVWPADPKPTREGPIVIFLIVVFLILRSGFSYVYTRMRISYKEPGLLQQAEFPKYLYHVCDQRPTLYLNRSPMPSDPATSHQPPANNEPPKTPRLPALPRP